MPAPLVKLGNEYGRPDMERVGLFSELPCMNGKGYTPLFAKPVLVKGKNMLSTSFKIKAATGDCYFDREFKRLFIGEGKGRKVFGKRPKHEGGIFRPSGEAKKHSTPGDFYGCFGDKLEAFSNVRRPKPPYKKQLPNCVTSPGKKGTGFGYAHVAINKYPEHMAYRHDYKIKYKEYGKQLGRSLVPIHWPQPYFDKNPYKEPPNMKPGPTYIKPRTAAHKATQTFVPTGPSKWQGGCHAGCFDKFPEHKPDKYVPLSALEKPKKHVGSTWYTQTHADVSYRTVSLIQHNIKFKVNQTNFTTAEPQFVEYLVKDKVNILI